MRTIFIADIHGCYTELRLLLKKVQFSVKRDKLVVLGDLMDRGPDSFEVWDYLINLKKAYPDKVELIWGNHELMLYEAYIYNRDFRYIQTWMRNGSEFTNRSFKKHGVNTYKEVAKDLEELFAACGYTEELCVSHAGIFNNDIENADFYDLVWNRNVLEGKTEYQGVQIIGHTPLKNGVLCIEWDKEGKPYVAKVEYEKRRKLPKRAIFDIDTGCVFGGSLTAMCVYSNNEYKLFKVGKDNQENS